MLGSEIRKMVLRRLDAELKPLGWKAYKSGHNPAYVLDTRYYKVFFEMGFKEGWIGFFYLEMAIKDVETYITECLGPERIPGFSLTIDNKSIFRKTIKDRNFSNYNGGVVETVDDVNVVVEHFFDYFFGSTKKFVETNLYLPNIVRKMDEFTSLEIIWGDFEKGFLCGIYDSYLRALTISKLCNDPLYNEKLDYVELRCKIYEEKNYPHYKDFRRDFERMKEILPTIEPKYSMDSPNEEAEMEKIRAMVAKNFTPVSAPTDKPKKKKTAKKFVPTPSEQVNKELLILLGSAQGEKESLLSRIKSIFGNKAKEEESSPQKQTLENVGCYLDASLRSHGFCNVHRDKSVFYYTRPTDVGNLIFSFTVGDNGRLCINPPSIRLDKVEEWMQKLFYPFKPGNFGCFGTFTLQLPKPLDELNDVVKASATDENIKQLCLATWQFIEDKFDDFAENYSSPQYLWERLCAYSKKSISWERLLFGVTPPERVLRGIVFIKLCNDNDFEDKFDYVETIFKKKANDFLPALEEIKSLLPEMKKEYEVCC
ncbi:hypothetical protein SAMN05216518_11735 [Bacteroidales bacterium KHT7]|nr:hypothetical protein SAMN05216518_11735 [Bacteroidales bacterium KHT7]